MRTKPAGGSWPSLASDQSRPPHSSRRSATEGPSTRGGSSQRGWGWFHANTPPAASRNCSASANVGKLLLTKTVRARRTCGDATTYEAVFRSECLVGTAHLAHAPQRRRRGVSE